MKHIPALLLALAATACQGLRSNHAPVLVWRDVALVSTNGPGPAVVYHVDWPVSGGAPGLARAIQAQAMEWLRLEDGPVAGTPEEALRRRKLSLEKAMDADRAAGATVAGYQELLKIESVYDWRGVLSMRMDQYVYTGGAHGMPMTQYAVFDRLDGHRLTLNDLIRAEGRAPTAELIRESLRAQQKLPPGSSLAEAGFWEKNIQPCQNFFLNEKGVWFCYQVYEIAPYASGQFAVCVPYRSIREWAKAGGPLDPGWEPLTAQAAGAKVP